MLSHRVNIIFSSFGLLLVGPILCGSTGRTNNFEARALSAHNRERSAMGVPPMRWNASLQASAQSWADRLALHNEFHHSPVDLLGDEGENLWAGTRGYYSVDAMVNAWIREKTNFRSASFPYNSITGNIEDVGHYTQLIWRRTLQVGCAMATGSDEDIMVCRYSQAGNWIGESPI